MDEPFSALDPFSREKLQDDVLEIQQRLKKTIVFVTHDMREALKLGDRICLMKDGEIVQVGTPHEFLTNPVNDFVREFVGNKQVPVRVEELMVPVTDEQALLPHTKTVSLQAPLAEVFEQLASFEQIAVEDGGKTVGVINRPHVMKAMSQYLRDGGRMHE